MAIYETHNTETGKLVRSVAVTEEGNELGVRVCEWHGDWVISSTRAFLTKSQAKALRNQIDWWLGAVVGEG